MPVWTRSGWSCAATRPVRIRATGEGDSSQRRTPGCPGGRHPYTRDEDLREILAAGPDASPGIHRRSRPPATLGRFVSYGCSGAAIPREDCDAIVIDDSPRSGKAIRSRVCEGSGHPLPRTCDSRGRGSRQRTWQAPYGSVRPMPWTSHPAWNGHQGSRTRRSSGIPPGRPGGIDMTGSAGTPAGVGRYARFGGATCRDPDGGADPAGGRLHPCHGGPGVPAGSHHLLTHYAGRPTPSTFAQTSRSGWVPGLT